MDNVFRIKKSRDTGPKTKTAESVSGTLDSIHQNIVTSMRETTMNLDELRKRKEEIEYELDIISDMYKVTKLQEELRTIQKRLDQEDPLKDYYLKNADIMLKYYGSGDKAQTVTTTPADQNTFVKYLTLAAIQEEPVVSRKELCDEFTSRMKAELKENDEGVMYLERTRKSLTRINERIQEINEKINNLTE